MQRFLEALRVQRWDDHRYYHHSRVNQSLHLVSAVSFLFAYAMVFQDPAMAALIGWLVAMTSRQVGHFFFVKDVETGLVWATKILTDPFHDIKLYYKAPLALLRGEWIDPHHARGDEWIDEDAVE